jgi:Heterokaryon incompatibility protein (HET)
MAEYNYEPLSSPYQIRLLLLDPGQHEEQLSCSLQLVSLEAGPDFEALSYVWGKSSDTRTIFCGDKTTMEIGLNLHTALQHLRHSDQPRLLWADAICINQKDVPERNQQVRIMGDIYSKARRCLIWFGEETEEVKNSFELIRLSLILRPKDGSRNLNLFSKLLLHQFQPVRAFMTREWFTRKWVIQEVVKSKEAMAICGFKTMPWDIIEEFAKVMEQEKIVDTITILHQRSHSQEGRDTSLGDSFEALGNVTAISNLRHGEDLQLLEVLRLTHYFMCTDFKDFLYAVLGLADDITTRHCDLPIDYSQSIQQILIGLSKWFVMEKKNLQFLHLVSGPMGSIADLFGNEIKFVRWLPGVPSWVLDLTTKTFPCMPINAPFLASGCSTPLARVSPDGSVLYLTGKIVDKIQTVGTLEKDTRLPLPPWIRQLLEHGVLKTNSKLLGHLETLKTYKWVVEFQQMVLGGASTLSSQRFEEFARTLVCDMSPNQQRASADITSAVDKYLKTLAELESKVLSVDRSGLLLDVIEYINDFDDKRISKETSMIYSSMGHFSQYGRFCITQKHRLGCVQPHAKPGDIICVFYGGNVPFLLRPKTLWEYEFLGPSYVHGIMDGEGLQMGIDEEFALC